MDLYQKEKDALLNFMLHERFFKYWEKNGISNHHLADLEIFITPECNQKCEYCYLQKRHEELYPSELLDRNNLIKKLRILLDFFYKKNYHVTEVELFTGEIWHTDFGVEILKIVLEYLKKGLDFKSIIIPSNGYFVKENKTLDAIQNLIYEYAKIDRGLLFSLSVDGAVIEDESRPLNSGEKKDEAFYERLFSFAVKNNFYFHPMISAQNVKYWIENHKWYYEKLTEYGSTENLDFMTLEVRNDDWTDEDIEKYAEYLRYDIEFVYKKGFNENLKLFSLYACDEFVPNFSHNSYMPFRIFENRLKAGNCSLPHTLTIRLGDLMITPCHRLSIPEYHYGQFIIENDEIIGIKANNTYMANRILFTNNDIASPKCDVCAVRDICIKGCFGSQYEHNGDPFLPIECNCKLQKTKIKTTFKCFEELGVIDEWKNYGIEMASYPIVDKLLTIWETIKKEEIIEKYANE